MQFYHNSQNSRSARKIVIFIVNTFIISTIFELMIFLLNPIFSAKEYYDIAVVWSLGIITGEFGIALVITSLIVACIFWKLRKHLSALQVSIKN